MELSFTAGIVVLLLIYWFRNPIKQKSEDIERDMKVASAESGVPVARKIIEIDKEVTELGEIPNINDILDRLNGTKANTGAHNESD